MKTLTRKSTVAQVVTELPISARLFDKYQINFCCNGKISLEEACGLKGLDPEAFISDLREMEENSRNHERDWTTVDSLSEIISHITEKYHNPLKTELNRLVQLATKVSSRHGERHPELVDLHQVFQQLKNELDMHLQKEETILFPIMMEIESACLNRQALPSFHCGSVANPMKQMEIEHEMAITYLEKMRALTNGYSLPERACNSYSALFYGLAQLEEELHKHIHLENYVLHPLAKKMEETLA